MEPQSEKFPDLDIKIEQIKALRNELLTYIDDDLTSEEYTTLNDNMLIDAWEVMMVKIRKITVLLSGGLATEEEKARTHQSSIYGLLDIDNPDSVFYWLFGIAQHDFKKPSDFLMLATGLRYYGVYPEGREFGEYEQSVKYELLKFIGFVDIFLKSTEKPTRNTEVSREEFMRTLGVNQSLGLPYVTDKQGRPINCKVEIDTDFKDIESFFSTRTIVINAIEAGARHISVSTIGTNTIRIFDDISDNWESDQRTQEYKDGLFKAFNDGVNEYAHRSIKEERGGAIAAFLAGQRYGRLIHSVVNLPSPVPFIHLVDNVVVNGIKGKSYDLDFPAGTTIEDSIVSYQKNS